jgi:ubiquinone/menaquinone biosynthesis C-methylase UbiE
MLGSIKANSVDKYLAPIRKQIVHLVATESTVIEYGCGNGDLLFQLAPHIKKGVGVDKSKQLIQYAKAAQQKRGLPQLQFIQGDACQHKNTAEVYDYAIASLLLHVIPRKDAIFLLKHMQTIARRLIICAFTPPPDKKQQLLLWFDQRFTNHYKHFKAYQQSGSIDGLLSAAGLQPYERLETFDPVIQIDVVIGLAS